MISLYGRDLVMLMELYICCHGTESVQFVVLAFKLFSFLSYIFYCSC